MTFNRAEWRKENPCSQPQKVGVKPVFISLLLYLEFNLSVVYTNWGKRKMIVK